MQIVFVILLWECRCNSSWFTAQTAEWKLHYSCFSEALCRIDQHKYLSCVWTFILNATQLNCSLNVSWMHLFSVPATWVSTQCGHFDQLLNKPQIELHGDVLLLQVSLSLARRCLIQLQNEISGKEWVCLKKANRTLMGKNKCLSFLQFSSLSFSVFSLFLSFVCLSSLISCV